MHAWLILVGCQQLLPWSDGAQGNHIRNPPFALPIYYDIGLAQGGTAVDVPSLVGSLQVVLGDAVPSLVEPGVPECMDDTSFSGMHWHANVIQ